MMKLTINKLLLIQWFSIVALAATAIADDPPPGCLCTVEQCCQNGTDFDCSLLTAHLGLLSSGAIGLTNFCDLYINNSTKDSSIGVCDAILDDTKFTERFVTPTSSFREASFWTENKRGESCSDLVTDTCPLKTIPFESSHWTAMRPGICSSSSISIPGTLNKVVSESGCKDDEANGVLNLLNDIVPITSDLDTCLKHPNAIFTMETSKGIDQKRWMCQEFTVVFNGTEETSVRALHVNLGNFPCTAVNEETPTAAPVVPDDTPISSSATACSTRLISSFSFAVSCVIVVFSTVGSLNHIYS